MLEALNEAFKDIFKSELDINSIKAQKFVNEANLHYNKAEYKEAKDLYEKAIKLGNDSGEIYAKLGYIYATVLSQDTGANVNDCYKKAIVYYKKSMCGKCESGL